MIETIFSKVFDSQLILLAIVLVVVFFVTEWSKAGRKRGRRRGNGRNLKVVRKQGDDPSLASAADQLRTVMGADFNSRALLNKPEALVFKALDMAVVERNSGWQVMAQVSLGEFLSSPDRRAFGCINSKRVDFALMNADCRVVHALEYQGKGHHQGNAAARDAVKKEALRKAGIGYHEIIAGHTTPSELRALVEKLVPAS